MYISRISTEGREQLTVDHLRETAAYASMLGGKFRLPSMARLAALFHDMGKFSDEFVQYLRVSAQCKKSGGDKPRRGSVIHATQGAKYIYEVGLSEKGLLLAAETASICAAGHHGGLMDSISPQGDTPLRDRLAANKEALHYEEVAKAFEREGVLSESIEELLLLCDDELTAFIKICRAEKLDAWFMVHMLVKSVFSCLVDSDRYNAYCFDIDKKPEAQLFTPPWGEYANRLEKHISVFPINSDIARIRKDISEKCLSASARPCGVYRLHVPTGGGKTLSSLRFALNHAKEHSMGHVIYVIPYLSVLEQTAGEIRKALQCRDDEEFVLEHHSNFVRPDDENEAQAYRLLTDRWSQPIIITTLVQFLESVFSHKAGNLRKLHNMANSVLIFDEVQSLPIKCVHLFNDALNYLHTFGKSTMLLCTATQPLIDKVETPIRLSSSCDLIADTTEVFERLKRTSIKDCRIRGGYSTEALRDFVLEKLDAAGNCLVILNTKTDASNLYKSVKTHMSENTETQIKLVHLSTLMCPAHRMDAIESMQETINHKKVFKNERILCISTQLIEAGVDISFASVVRALAGLDSIMQAAGRCNRNGEDPEGREVYVVNLAEENLSRLPDIKCGSDVTSRILGELVDDLQSHTVMDRYYEEYFYKRSEGMNYPYDGGNIYDLLSSNKKGRGTYINFGGQAPLPRLLQAFQTAGEQFYVIERNTTSVLVPYERGVELAAAYKKANLKDKARLLREMGRYSVSLYPYQKKKLEEMHALSLIDDDIYVLDKAYHDSVSLGVVFKGDPEFLCV
ncbi:MAG: CRISPR-associated helicase Cas3 [Bacillota bacterium]|nr:MAG: CRISPR-associated helicase Cas3 [Bacillota bacterium]MBS3949361.1 CRISPR-associated helicase Cas3' [Peptococcaceae bacterium]